MIFDWEILNGARSILSYLLINSCYSAILAALLLLLKLFYSNLPKNIEYGLWCVVLIRLVLPIDLNFSMAIPAVAVEWMKSLLPSSGVKIDYNTVTYYLGNTWVVDGLLIAWAGTAGLVLIRYIVLRVKLLRMINRSQPIVDYPIIATANRWRLNFWIKQPVHVIAEDKYLSPFTFFFKSPIIFIPRKILESNDEVLIQSIIAHEMAHVKRKDSLWLILQNIIQIIYFFNPLVWWIVRRMSALRESLCDQMVLSAKQISPEEYGESLIKVLRFNINGEFSASLSSAFLGYKNQIKKRIEGIGNFDKPFRFSKLQFALVLVCGIFFLPFLTQPPIGGIAAQVVLKDDPNSPFPAHIREQVKLPEVKREKD